MENNKQTGENGQMEDNKQMTDNKQTEENKQKADTAIFYYSAHHGNTKKLLDAIKKNNEVDLIDLISLSGQDSVNLGNYSKIGFASGIYMSKLHKSCYAFVERHSKELNSKETFIIATGGAANNRKTINEFCERLQNVGAIVKGNYYCNGYDTYGPFKLLGGIRKGHPTEKECREVVDFYERMNGKSFSN